MKDAAEAVVRPFKQAGGGAAVSNSDSPLFDQLMLFPMKLGLSMALADGDSRQSDRDDEAAADDRHI